MFVPAHAFLNDIICQIFVILAKEHGAAHPVIHGLLPNKAVATYRRFFELLLQLRPNLQPETINCDFEIAAFQTMSDVRYFDALLHGYYTRHG